VKFVVHCCLALGDTTRTGRRTRGFVRTSGSGSGGRSGSEAAVRAGVMGAWEAGSGIIRVIREIRGLRRTGARRRDPRPALIGGSSFSSARAWTP